jgi:glutaredoxin
MPPILYTLPQCAHCDTARTLLAELNLPYREIVIDNPVLEVGMKTALGKVLAPVLLQPNGDFHFLVEIAPSVYRFVRLLV